MSKPMRGSFDPEAAWRLAFQFLLAHARTPAGEPVSDPLGRLLMVGAWVGARFAALDPSFGLALARHGNEQQHDVYRRLQAGFVEELGGSVTGELEQFAETRGFAGTKLLIGLVANSGDPPEFDAQSAVEAAIELLKQSHRDEEGES